MATSAEKIRNAILGKYPLIYLLTWEEGRAIQLLEAFAAKLYGGENGIAIWSCLNGYQSNGSEPQDACRTPLEAVEAILNSPDRKIYVLKDFSSFIKEPAVTRALRDAYYKLQGQDKFVFIVSPEFVMPETLKKEVLLIDMDLPDEDELFKLVQRTQQAYGDALPPETASQLAFALKGLTLNEAGHILNRIFRGKKRELSEVMDEIFSEKEMVVKKSGFLEFVPPRHDIAGIGGLDNLKDWLIKRERLFSRKALEDGVPVPKGILVMGMSGCGKSLAAKAISALWKVPLFRLDMNLVFSGMYGSPELAFHRALKTVEAVAPAVLWIDEIENSLGMDEAGAGSSANPFVFSTFLTWMQEKPPLVFVAATANRIQAIPAEVLRKGRFDQIFFVDLPNDEERKQIFSIHLARNGANVSDFDLVFLAAATKGWNGAEIEQAVIAGRIEAYHDGRKFTIDDITRNTARMVPLSKTMEDQMKRIRSWAFGRATPASRFATVQRI